MCSLLKMIPSCNMNFNEWLFDYSELYKYFFFRPDNSKIPCSVYPKLDLRKWKDDYFSYGFFSFNWNGMKSTKIN